jgi:hypothetical protein
LYSNVAYNRYDKNENKIYIQYNDSNESDKGADAYAVRIKVKQIEKNSSFV